MTKKEKNNEKKSSYTISGPIETIEKKGNKLKLESESTKFIVILLCIVAFIGMLWLVDTLKNNKNDEEKSETKTATINYNEVLVGNMLEQKYDNYLVYAYNKDEEDSSSIEYLLTSAEHYYKLNLDIANNLPAVAEKSNFKGTIDKIKFKGTTLLLIEKGKIVKYYEGSEEIIKYLENIKK